MAYEKTVVQSDKVKPPGSQYSKALKVGPWVFVAGLQGVDPKTGTRESEDIEREIELLLHNVQSLLEGAGSSLEHLVKTTVIIKNAEVYELFKQVRKRVYPPMVFPISTAFVAEVLGGANIEMDAIALVPDRSDAEQ